jgi:hypothetical protein
MGTETEGREEPDAGPVTSGPDTADTLIQTGVSQSHFWKLISTFRLDASSGIRSKRSCTFV